MLQILAVIGRYGPHLMIVVIFVTQKTFEMVQKFPTVTVDSPPPPPPPPHPPCYIYGTASCAHYGLLVGPHAGWGSNTEPEQRSSIPSLASDCRKQSTISSRHSTEDCFKYGQFWGAGNFSYKLIHSVLYVSVKRYTLQNTWHQEGSVKNKYTLYTCTSAACVYC